MCLLSHTDFTSVDVISCKCAALPQVLVQFGVFPTAPSQPRMAISLDLLGLYWALFERSCDAVNILAAALHMHYMCHGFHLMNKKEIGRAHV